MIKLEQLFQDDCGQILNQDKTPILHRYLIPRGKIKTLMMKKKDSDISSVISEMINKNKIIIPPQTNSYILSDLIEIIQEAEENGEKEVYAVYAVQFYFNIEGLCY